MASTKHTISWWAISYDADGRSIRYRRPRGLVGHKAFEASCSCGWETRTGGAIESYIKTRVKDHRDEEEVLDLAREYVRLVDAGDANHAELLALIANQLGLHGTMDHNYYAAQRIIGARRAQSA